MDHIVYIAVLHISVMMFISALFITFWLYFYFAYEAISTTQLIGYYVLWAVCSTNFFLLGPIAITLLTKEIRIKCMTRTTLFLYVLLCLASITPTPLLSNVFGRGERTRTYVRDFYLEHGRVPYLMDYIQRYQRCCGHNNYTDYYRSPEDQEEDDVVLNEPVPLSCCSEIVSGCERSIGLTYKQGCFIMPLSNSPTMAWEHPYHGTGFLAVVLIPLVLPLFQFMQMCFLHDAFAQVYSRRKNRIWRLCDEEIDQEGAQSGAGDATEVNVQNSKSNSFGSRRTRSSSSTRLVSVTSAVFPMKFGNRETARSYANDIKSKNSWNSMFMNMDLDSDSPQSKDSDDESESSWSSEASEESSRTQVAKVDARNMYWGYNNNDRRGYKKSVNRSRRYAYRPQTGRYDYENTIRNVNKSSNRRKEPLKSQGNDDQTWRSTAVAPPVSTPTTRSPDAKSKSSDRSKLREPTVGRNLRPQPSIKISVYHDKDEKSGKKILKNSKLVAFESPPIRKMLAGKEPADSYDDQASIAGDTTISVASKSVFTGPFSNEGLDLTNAGGVKDKGTSEQPHIEMLAVGTEDGRNAKRGTLEKGSAHSTRKSAQDDSGQTASQRSSKHSDSTGKSKKGRSHSAITGDGSIEYYETEVAVKYEYNSPLQNQPEETSRHHDNHKLFGDHVHTVHNETHNHHTRPHEIIEHAHHRDTHRHGQLHDTHRHEYHAPSHYHDNHEHDHHEHNHHHDNEGHEHHHHEHNHHRESDGHEHHHEHNHHRESDGHEHHHEHSHHRESDGHEHHHHEHSHHHRESDGHEHHHHEHGHHRESDGHDEHHHHHEHNHHDNEGHEHHHHEHNHHRESDGHEHHHHEHSHHHRESDGHEHHHEHSHHHGNHGHHDHHEHGAHHY